MARKSRVTEPAKQVNAPLLPLLSWDRFFWVGTDTLPSWAGFHERGPFARKSETPSEGRVIVSVEPATNDNEPAEPMPEQVRAYEFLKSHERSVASAVLTAIFDGYPALRKAYGLDDDLMPEIHAPDDLRVLMGINQVHVLRHAKDGLAYVGFEFECTWDPDHGLGVMTHGERIVDVGAADTSFCAYAPEFREHE